MVDALRRAHEAVTPDGCVLDLHPSTHVPSVEANGAVLGHVVSADGRERHAAASRAIETVVAAGLFERAQTAEFTFLTHGDSVEELRNYVLESWRSAHIPDSIQEAGRAVIRERIWVTKLLPRALETLYNRGQ